MAKPITKCATPRCRGKRPTNRKSPSPFCDCCRAKQWKAAHPFSYFYNAQRNNARRRGKEFTITLEEFKAFAIREGLMLPDGTKIEGMSIDRRQHEHGYHIWNIQVLKVGHNTRKRFVDYYRDKMDDLDPEEQQKWREYEDRLQAEIDQQKAEIEQHEDLPF